MKKILQLIKPLLIASALTLAACGGSNSNDPGTEPDAQTGVFFF